MTAALTCTGAMLPFMCVSMLAKIMEKAPCPSQRDKLGPNKLAHSIALNTDCSARALIGSFSSARTAE
eukprot:2468124-Amphidinium_carterae.1